MTGLKKALAVLLALQLAWGPVPVRALEEALDGGEAEPAEEAYEDELSEEELEDVPEWEDLGNAEIDAQLRASREEALQALSEEESEPTYMGGAIPPMAPALSVHDSEEEDLAAQAELPTRYDSRERGVITAPRNQDLFGTCWAFGATAAMEASLLAHGIVSDAAGLDLSERHLAYFTYHNQTDPLGNTEGDQTIATGHQYGDALSVDPYLFSGANCDMAAYALASWMGVVREDAVGTYAELVNTYGRIEKGKLTEDQFLIDTALDHDDARGINSFRLTGMRKISYADKSDIKQAIMDYGAVAADVNFDNRNTEDFNSRCGTLYHATPTITDHVVSIVGWDDDFDPKYFGRSNGLSRIPSATEVPNPDGDVELGKEFAMKRVDGTEPKTEYYRFQPTESGTYAIRIAPRGDDGASASAYADLYVVTESGGMAMVASASAQKGAPATLNTILRAGETYYISSELAPRVIYTMKATFDKPFDTTVQPASKGAWLCKNSWGNFNLAEGAYFWLSYEDASTKQWNAKTYVFDVKEAGDLNNIYQYDGSCSEYTNSVESGGAIANVFTTAASAGESLKEVGFALEDVNVNYGIQVYLNLSDANVPTSGVPYFAEPVTGSTSHAGYYTVALPEAVPLHKGTDFAVVITLSSQDGNDVRYNIDESGQGDWYKCVSVTKPGQSFVQEKAGGAWADLVSEPEEGYLDTSCAARIKAFTTNVAESEIPKPSVAYADVKLGSASKPYDGMTAAPGLTVRYGTTVLKEGVDYTATLDSADVGKRTVTITGMGAYTGTRTLSLAYRVTFKDVAADSWAFSTIHRAADAGIVSGYTDDKTGSFGPGNSITRGQVAVTLWRMAGKPAAGAGAKSFPDNTDTQAYYYEAVRWASSVGVVSGYATGTFGPKDKVTREQLAVMLANYAKRVGGIKVSGSATDYVAMKDADTVASWAQRAVGWCFQNKIISGTKAGTVNPKGNATRAEAAKMLVGLYDLVK